MPRSRHGPVPGWHGGQRHVLPRVVQRRRLRHPRGRLLLRRRIACRVRGQGQAVQDGQLHLVRGGQELQLVQPVRLQAPLRRLLEGRRAQLPSHQGRAAEMPVLHRVHQRGAQDRAARTAAAPARTACARGRLLRRDGEGLQVRSWRALSEHRDLPSRHAARGHCRAVLRHVQVFQELLVLDLRERWHGRQTQMLPVQPR